MESTIEATGNKVDDLSYVHGFGMAQGLTQQGFSFINMELLGNCFNEFNNKLANLIYFIVFLLNLSEFERI